MSTNYSLKSGHVDAPLPTRCAAAATSSALATLVVTPLDVIKARMQAHVSATAGDISHWCFRPVSLASFNAGGGLLAATNAGGPAFPRALGVTTELRRIVAHEGTGALWTGTRLGIMMQVPLIGIYLPLYDLLQGALPLGDASRTLVAGTAARAVAVVATSPIEFYKVKSQAAGRAAVPLPQPSLASLLAKVRGSASPLAAASYLWTGVGASLAKDLPFAAIYWSCLEPARRTLLPNGHTVSGGELAAANAAAAAASAAVAAAATQPFDVIKTAAQTAAAAPGAPRRGMADTASAIWRSRGPAGLLTGLGPRVARSSAAYAMVMAAYELLKWARVSPH